MARKYRGITIPTAGAARQKNMNDDLNSNTHNRHFFNFTSTCTEFFMYFFRYIWSL